jgi:hypothetical protein
MSEKAIAVDGCVLEPVSPATGTITIEPNQASEDVFVGEKGVYFKEIKFKVTNSNGGGSVTNNDGEGEGSIIATGGNILFLPDEENENKVVLEGDLSDEVTINGTAGDQSASGIIKVRVKSAGQSDVFAL